MLRSKADIIRQDLKGLRVLDVGGAGYGQSNPYERELAAAWSGCRRTTLDADERADLRVDLNRLPLAPLEGAWDVATLFDVLEHLEHPVEVLRWLPAERLIVNVPNARSFLARRMERIVHSSHLYSFVPYTLDTLLRRGGWTPCTMEWQSGKWSLQARLVNAAARWIHPPTFAIGLTMHARRAPVGAPAGRADYIASPAARRIVTGE